MAKKYTRAEWQRMQAKLPEEDRTPYEDSPDVPDQIQGKRGGDSQAAAKTYAATPLETITGATTPAYEDPYYTVDPKTGLSPAQLEARKALEEAQKARTEVGLPGKLVTTPGSAGQISTPPTEGLKEGYEWYAAPVAGGGFEWRQKPSQTFLRNAYQTLFSAGSSGPSGASGPSSAGSSGPSGNQGTYTATDGTKFTDANAYATYQASLNQQNAATLAMQQQTKALADQQQAARQSAYDLLYQQFSQYGLGQLVEPLKGLIQSGISPAEFTLRLRDTDAYKQRFAANAQRIAKGLSALSEAQYIQLEDQYQNVMRQYGLPESYYAKGDMGVQPGFQKFIAGDVSPAELEDRIQTAQNRVINAAPEIKTALQQFYPGITNGDILAYTLDPQNALTNIKRKVAAAEIGGAALQAGLGTSQQQAEMLQQYGVTQAQAQQGYQTIGGGLQRGSELASIYSQSPYTQTTAEQEVFGIPGAAEAQKKRKQLIGLEKATFGGQTGAGGALQRERSGAY